MGDHQEDAHEASLLEAFEDDAACLIQRNVRRQQQQQQQAASSRPAPTAAAPTASEPSPAPAAGATEPPAAVRAAAGALVPEGEQELQVLLFYAYVTIQNPVAAVALQTTLCERLGLLGRVRVATEGINGTLSGSPASLREYIEATGGHEMMSGRGGGGGGGEEGGGEAGRG